MVFIERSTISHHPLYTWQPGSIAANQAPGLVQVRSQDELLFLYGQKIKHRIITRYLIQEYKWTLKYTLTLLIIREISFAICNALATEKAANTGLMQIASPETTKAWVCLPKRFLRQCPNECFGQSIISNLFQNAVALNNTWTFSHPKTNKIKKSIVCIISLGCVLLVFVKLGSH